MTLRRRVSPVLRFGWLVDHGQQTCLLTLDTELCAVTLSRDFAIFGSLAVIAQFSFRPMTLRRRVFPVLLFLGADLLSRTQDSISIQQVF
jgi:hypothetical protein